MRLLEYQFIVNTHCKQFRLLTKCFEQKISLAKAKANEGFLEKMNKITNNSSTYVMQTIIDHYIHHIFLILKNRQISLLE